jgi:DNA-binding transcriptional LysR family regulator
MIEPSLLRYFYAVATEGNFTKAGARLHIGQPVVSQMVKTLEMKLGVTLFERQKRTAILTREGQELFKSCRLIFQELESIEGKLKNTTETISGTIRLGATDILAASILPDVSKEFLGKFADSQLHMVAGPSFLLADLIVKNQIDFALTGYIYDFPLQLEGISLGMISYHVVMHKDIFRQKSKWPEITFVSSRSVESETVDAQPTFEKLKELIPNILSRISTNSLLAHKTLVMKKAAIAILPDFLIEKELKNGTLKYLFHDEAFNFPITLLKRKSFPLGTLETWFVEEFKRRTMS